MDALDIKYEQLKATIAELGQVAIAFSSGVDSTLVLWAASEALGEHAVAYTATSHIFPSYEMSEAEDFCRQHNIPHVAVQVDPFVVEGYADNPPDRCYHCKHMLFGKLIQRAEADGMHAVLDGTNADDIGMYRPGMRALAELKVVSPLKDLGLTKAEIRELSTRHNLPTAKKPSFACLMTRFSYGMHVDKDMLDMVDKAESYLLREGFEQVRVRYHDGKLARIELGPGEAARMLENNMAARIDKQLRDIGFEFVTLDLSGYATGKMNEQVEAELLQRQRDNGQSS